MRGMYKGKILFLGAAPFQVPAIKYAKQKGYKVLTADNRPENPGHAFADQSFVISTVDKIAICQLAEEYQINGVVPFASDVSAPTAHYVVHHLNLPGKENLLESIPVLTDKARFRMTFHQDLVIKVLTEKEVLENESLSLKFPVVVKPVDSSGSKGVTMVMHLDQLKPALHSALAFSRSRKVIIEKFVSKKGPQICGDGFMLGGKLVFLELGDGHFYSDSVHNAPYAETFPSIHSEASVNQVFIKVESFLKKVGYYRGPFNLDAWISDEGGVFINEIGPRSGGNFIPVVIKLNTGVDLVGAAVDSAVDPYFSLVTDRKPRGPFFASYMIHSLSAGIFQGINLSGKIKERILASCWYIPLGSKVEPFWAASQAIGNMIFRFEDEHKMRELMSRINQLVRVNIE